MILGCLARDFFPETIDFGWKDESNASIASGFKNFRPVSQTGPGDKVTTFASSQLTVANANWEQRKIFYCQATHESKTKTVRLQKREVIILPPTVSINPPLRDSTSYNGTATIVCVISGFSPNNIQVRWLKNFNQTIESTTDEPVADKNGGFKTISAITIPWIELDRGYEFSCEVKHEASNFYELKNVSGSQGCDMPSSGIQVTTIPPTFESIFTEKKAKLTCKVSHMSSTDGLSISWYQKGKSEDLQTKLEDGIYSNGITVIGIAEVCVDDWQKDRFECKVKHPDLAALKVVALFKQNGGFTSSPEVYIYPPHQDELAQGETATLACLVKGFSPNDAFVKWTHMGEPLDPSVYINTEPIKELSATGKSTYFMYSKLNIEPKNWTDGKSYTCVVGHETLPLQLVQKTIDKYTGKAHAVNVSLVMSDTC
uniref:Ig-like domain-containing protein n=1 Tax=Leptobrachium leishanense TaxID=445787 RepID=A0A8C5MD03_9ANUR